MVLVALALLCFLWVWRTTVYARRAQAHLDAARTHARDVFTLHPGTTVLWDAEAAARGENPHRGWLLPNGRAVKYRYWLEMEGVKAKL